MNYIRELNAFYDWLETNPLNHQCIALWHALMHTNSKAGWKKEFTVAVITLELKTGLNRRAIERARNTLEQVGLIRWRKRSGNQSAIYEMIPLSEKFVRQNDIQTVAQSDAQSDAQTDVQSVAQTVAQSDAQSVAINKTKRNETKQENIPYTEIVAYLNERTGSSFRPATKATQSHIRARWREGFKLEDFFAVIDNMVEKWGNDPKMSQYLRPETLFGPKFESYLNARKKGVGDDAKPRTSPPRGRGEYDFLSL